jgi:peptidoglycan lytic transglycosylase G
LIRKVLAVVLPLILLAILAAQELERRWRQPLAVPPSGYGLTVNLGDSLRAVITRLHAEGLVPHPNLIILYARWTGDDQKIKHGEYLLPPQSTAISLLELLKSGKVIQYQVTLPEGITLMQALEILALQTQLEPVIKEPDDARLLELVKPHAQPEGLFFPDTYHFARGTTDWELLQRANAKMLATLERQWQQRAPGLPYANAYEALIMASIIERETGLPSEREQIAGVFVRRLQAGMRLQTDPAVIYGLGSEFDGNLTRAHLADDSNPFNTYRHRGLPPTPIALPGEGAIHAALHPDQGNALFFVARGDGGHVFSATLAEHELAVRKYQLRRRTDYRSSPGKP